MEVIPLVPKPEERFQSTYVKDVDVQVRTSCVNHRNMLKDRSSGVIVPSSYIRRVIKHCNMLGKINLDPRA